MFWKPAIAPARCGRISRNYWISLRGRSRRVCRSKLQQTITPASLKTLQGGYGDYLTESVKKHDFRAQLNTPAEVMARGVRDNVTVVFRNFDRR